MKKQSHKDKWMDKRFISGEEELDNLVLGCVEGRKGLVSRWVWSHLQGEPTPEFRWLTGKEFNTLLNGGTSVEGERKGGEEKYGGRRRKRERWVRGSMEGEGVYGKRRKRMEEERGG